MSILYWLFMLPVVLIAAVAIAQPWHWPIFSPALKKYLANRKIFFAEPREESAIPVQRGRRLRKMIIATSDPVRRAAFEQLIKAKNYDPNHVVLLPLGEAFAFVGWPIFGLDTVQPWFWTEDLEMATPAETHHSTMTLKMQTVLFPAKLSADVPEGKQKSPRQELEEKIRAARSGGEKLSPEQVRRAMGLEHHETEDNFQIPFDVELDLEFTDPWLCRNSIQYPGELIVGLLDAAALAVISSLRVLSIDAEDTPSSNVVQRQIEPRLLVALGFNKPTDEMTQANITAPDDEHNLVKVLAKYGITVHRARAKNVQLPPELEDIFKKPVMARAEATATLIEANAAKAARKAKGEGEGAYLTAVAVGERKLVEAFSTEDGKVTDGAVAARLARGAQEAWTAGVSKAAAGKVVITGSPGMVTPNADGIVAGLAGVASTVTSALQPPKDDDKSKSNKDAPTTPAPTPTTDDEDDDDEDDPTD